MLTVALERFCRCWLESDLRNMWIQMLFPLVVVGAVGLLLRAIVIGRRPDGTEAPSVHERVALGVAFALALIPSLLLLIIPVSAGIREVASASGGPGVVMRVHGTLVQANDLWALVPLLLPVALTVTGLAARASRRRRSVIRAAAVLLTVFVVLAGFSIGLFYLPAAVALGIAAFRTPQAERTA